jgi:putative nucleotidyltransferase with HDIG domain
MHIKVRSAGLSEKQILASNLVTADGRLILGAGTVLNETKINRLREMGIAEVWIERENLMTLNPGQDEIESGMAAAYERAARDLAASFQKVQATKKIEVAEIIAALQRFEESCAQETNPFKIYISLLTEDDSLAHHAIRVAMLSKRLGSWLGLEDDPCEELLLAGALHDIGKTQLPPELVQKRERLTDEEMNLYQSHPTIGYDLLQKSRLPERIAQVAKNHHEYLNGSGYPYGLQGEEIDLYSRIVAVANEFVNMTSITSRYWSVSFYNAMEEIVQLGFGKLDPRCVWMLKQHLRTYFVGNRVLLSDGTAGQVVYVCPYQDTKPLLCTEQGFLDLGEQRDLQIRRVISW